MPLQDDFGEKLRALRRAAGLSQEALAGRAALSVDAIASLERGRRRRPRPSTVTALGKALGLTADERAALLQAGRPPIREIPRGAEHGLMGRERELDSLAELVREIRPGGLVTVQGPGGVGKTALVKAVTSSMAGEYRHGVAFVDVSALAQIPLVAAAAAHALGLPEPAGRGPAQLGRALAQRDALVVLDSAERVAGLGAFAAELCRRAPGLTLVVTSRIPLDVADGHCYPVSPLAVPDAFAGPADLAENPSVRLFVERARAVAPRFEVTEHNAAAVAALCVRLGGLPLALELAAARVRLVPVAELLARSAQGLELLSTSSARAPERHRSLRATLDWTYELLDPAARSLFATLGVFRGGFSAEAAEQVHGTRGRVLDRLDELLDAGLLICSPLQDGHLGMLDTIGDYARDLLAASHDGDELRDRHGAYYLDLAEHVRREARTRGAEGFAMLERNHDNLRAALDWYAAKGEGSELRLAVVLSRFWQLRGHLDEGRRRLAHALARRGGTEALRGRAHYELAILAFNQGDLTDAHRHAELSLALHGAVAAAQEDVADVLNILGNIARERGDHAAATQHYESSLALYRADGDLAGVAAALANLGTTAYRQRDFARAAVLHNESLSIRAGFDDTVGVARCLYGLANAARESGDLDSALDYGQRSLALREKLGDRHGCAVTLIALASTYRARGEPPQAADHAARALPLGRAVGDPWIAAMALAVTVGALRDQGRWHSAASTAGMLSIHLDISGLGLDPADADRLADDLAAVQQKLGRAAYDRAHTLARADAAAGSESP